MVVSAEERRARNAEKQRRYRERQRELREAEQAKSGNAGNGPVPTTQRDAVDATLKAAKWLTDADAASMAQARALAKSIDELAHSGDLIRMLSAHRALSQVMNDLGATATKRLQYELRSRKAQEGGGDGGEDGGSSTSTGGNVTQLRRPPKRRA